MGKVEDDKQCVNIACNSNVRETLFKSSFSECVAPLGTTSLRTGKDNSFLDRNSSAAIILSGNQQIYIFLIITSLYIIFWCFEVDFYKFLFWLLNTFSIFKLGVIFIQRFILMNSQNE